MDQTYGDYSFHQPVFHLPTSIPDWTRLEDPEDEWVRRFGEAMSP